MKRVALYAVAVLTMAACAEKRLMTADVQSVTATAVQACVRVLTGGPQLSSLQSQGFVPFRGGYLRMVPNPEIFGGDSRVAATIRNGKCVVETWPASFSELSTMQGITERALVGTGLTARYRQGGSRSEVSAEINR